MDETWVEFDGAEAKRAMTALVEAAESAANSLALFGDLMHVGSEVEAHRIECHLLGVDPEPLILSAENRAARDPRLKFLVALAQERGRAIAAL